MQREIKFRAWDKRQKQMSRIFTLIELTQYEHIFEVKFKYLAQFKDLIWLEYTGLKDKNGKEIFEGDITNYGAVEWCECLNWDGGGSNHPGFYFKDKYEYGAKGDLSYHDGFDDGIEVIGNIWENPELLEVK